MLRLLLGCPIEQGRYPVLKPGLRSPAETPL
jgi:hypothetical protein